MIPSVLSRFVVSSSEREIVNNTIEFVAATASILLVFRVLFPQIMWHCKHFCGQNPSFVKWKDKNVERTTDHHAPSHFCENQVRPKSFVWIFRRPVKRTENPFCEPSSSSGGAINTIEVRLNLYSPCSLFLLIPRIVDHVVSFSSSQH